MFVNTEVMRICDNYSSFFRLLIFLLHLNTWTDETPFFFECEKKTEYQCIVARSATTKVKVWSSLVN